MVVAKAPEKIPSSHDKVLVLLVRIFHTLGTFLSIFILLVLLVRISIILVLCLKILTLLVLLVRILILSLSEHRILAYPPHP